MFGSNGGKITSKLRELSTQVEGVMEDLEQNSKSFPEPQTYHSLIEKLEKIRSEIGILISLSNQVHELIEETI